MNNESIGELEELILLATGSLAENAYAITISAIIKEKANRTTDITSIHSVLRRLEKKGMVKSSMGGATKERGGRRKRYFRLTPTGRAVLDESMKTRLSLYKLLPKLSFNTY